MDSSFCATEPMAPHEVEAVIAAHVATRRSLIPDPRSWMHRSGGLIASAAEIPCPTCNTIYVHGRDASEAEFAQLLDRFAARPVPFHVSIRAALADRFGALARDAGLRHLVDLPLMTVTPREFRPAGAAAELQLRVLPPGEDPIHLGLVAEGLGMSLEGTRYLMSPANLASPGWTTYVGDVDGRLAVTGSAIDGPDGTALISIVTDPDFSRRGFAAALTRLAVANAFDRGQPRVFLHSSAQGLRVYERLGFRAVEDLCVFGRDA